MCFLNQFKTPDFPEMQLEGTYHLFHSELDHMLLTFLGDPAIRVSAACGMCAAVTCAPSVCLLLVHSQRSSVGSNF